MRKALAKHLIWCLYGAFAVLAWIGLHFGPPGSMIGALLRATPPIALWLPAAPLLVISLFLRPWSRLAVGAVVSVGAWSLLLGFPAMGSGRGGTRGDLRVVTYNVMMSGNGEDQLSAQIASLQPDILATQETKCYRPHTNARRAVERALPGYHIVQREDMLIASRYPILRVEHIPFPGNNNFRFLIRAHIDVKGQVVTVINTHNAPTLLEEYPSVMAKLKRMCEIDRVRSDQCARLAGMAAETDGPVLVVGDFNHSPLGPAYGSLRTRLTDSFAAAGRGYGHTLTSDWPVKRVDYIFARNTTPVRSYVLRTPASDHLPLIAEFKLPAGPDSALAAEAK